ncbi:MAG: hypothetical protein JNG85_13235 [Spirochaetaceae bacterium]|nr:hypothetical protein [Spirochaetaceae bacterium]
MDTALGGLERIVRGGAKGLSGVEELLAARADLAALALRETLRELGGDRSVASYAAYLASRTACLTLLAGAGSRWVKSVSLARERGVGGAAATFDLEKPRGLFPVRDLLAGRPSVPLAAYTLAAVRGLGSHVIVTRGAEPEIEAEILLPLGFLPGSYRFFTQEAPFGKPLGHGDAAWQCRALWGGADYVVTNFGGDANSRLTVLSSLLVLDALVSRGEDVDLLIPAAYQPNPAYPIRLDAEGLPRGFGHAKLQGTPKPGSDPSSSSGSAAGAYTNVGLRIYRAPALLAAVESFRREYWEEGTGYAIPGNDPAGHEFALDNVDAALAAAGRARILPIARPEELCPAKAYEDLPAFEAAVEKVLVEDLRAGFQS